MPAAERRPVPSISSRVRRVRRAVLLRRRLLASALAALAVLAGVRAADAPAVETVAVVVAASDLPGGGALGAEDLAVADFPAASVPSGTARSPETVAGRVLAAPLRRGEPVTDVRLVAPSLLAGYPGLVAAPVRVADAAVVELLEVGDRVDLVATAAESGRSTIVVSGAPVVALPHGDGSEDGLAQGGLVVVAVEPDRSLALAEASVSSVMSVVLGS